MKQVRIDKKTVIEVDDNMPDEIAKARYLEKLSRKPQTAGGFMKGYKADRKNAVRDTPRHDLVFEGDNTMRRLQHSR